MGSTFKVHLPVAPWAGSASAGESEVSLRSLSLFFLRVLVDVDLRRLGGISAAERIRQVSLPERPQIIELEHEANRHGHVPGTASGVGGVLAKPVSDSTLEELMRFAGERVNALGAVSPAFLLCSLRLALTLVG